MAFMGRDRELAQLARALQRSSDGEAVRTLVAAQAGMGSSSLLDAFAARVSETPDTLFARGRGYEPMVGQPYAAVATALGSVLDTLSDEQLVDATAPAAHDLSTLLPWLAPRLDALGVSREPPRLESPALIGSRVVEGIIGTLERLAGDGVVVLALEDLHWADPGTRGFIDTLLRVGRRLPIYLLLTYQPDELDRRHPCRDFIARLTDSAGVEVLRLGPLTSDELASISEEMSGERPSGSFVAALVEGSGGNPLIATQLMTAHAVLDGMRLSDPFEEVLAARLDALPPSALRAVRLLAAARRPLPRSVCLSIPLRDGRLDRQAIEGALASGLVIEVDGGPDVAEANATREANAQAASDHAVKPHAASPPAASGQTAVALPAIAIAHELYAEAIEAVTLAPERHAIHAALGASPHINPAEAAWHLTVAWQPVAARAAHLAAAQAASRLDPGETTLLQYQAALDLGEAAADPADAVTDLAATLLAAADAAANAGSFRRAAALVKRAIDARPRRVATGSLTSRTPAERAALQDAHRAERQRQGELHERLGRYRWAGGDLVGGLQRMREAVEFMPSGPSRGRARAQAVLAQHLMLDGSFAESAEIARDACNTAKATDPVALVELGHATCTLGVDMAYLGQLDRGLTVLEKATEIAHRLGRLDDLMRAYANRTTLLDLDSRREQALNVVNEGIRDARGAGLGETYGAFLRGNAADILFNLGRWEESEIECRAGMAYRPAGVAWFSPILYLGLVLVESRADEEATRLVGQTLLQLEQVPAGQWTALVLRAAVSLLLWRGEAADAVEVCTREWDRVQETADALQIAMAASTALEAAAALADAGRQRRDLRAVATASELATRALADAERHVAASPLSPTLGARREAELHLEVARAHLERLRGRPSADRWDAIAQAWAAIPVPYLEAKARWWQALAELQLGDGRLAAQAPLLEAWRISEELPAAPLRRTLADLARRARINLPGRSQVMAPIAIGPLRPVSTPAHVVRETEDEYASTSPREGRALVPVGPGRQTFDLSPREMEVLVVLAEGRTNCEIAERLFISDRTVGVHVRRILFKLSVAGRTEATGKAIRLGLVPNEPAAAVAVRPTRD